VTRIVALVPMRHDSERVKGKNYRPLGGRPLYHHIVSALLASARIDSVVIDTDSSLIAGEVESMFPQVRVLPRPTHLLGGDVPMNAILLHDVEEVEADFYVQTHSTNPLLRTETIDAAIDEFLASRDDYDSLFTVTPLHTRLWTPTGQPINHDPNVLLRTQDLPPVMQENSCMYVFDAATLRERGNRIGHRPLLYALDPHEACDIDDEYDWLIVESLYLRRVAER
jgi:CMP-N-acetylneuraminic acid synthetase